MPDTYALQTIAYVLSPYKQKFGVPRQPGLVPSARVYIEFLPEFSADCVRGLESFSHIWVQFVFHGVAGTGWQPLVRPPRLGPNPLGLSLLKLERIETEGRVRLWCGGADLLDGTPVLDIKPYLPFVEAQPDAAPGFAAVPPVPLEVAWADEISAASLPPSVRLLIEQSIAQDPRPAYQDTPQRVYKMAVGDWEVAFRIENGTALIEAVMVAEG